MHGQSKIEISPAPRLDGEIISVYDLPKAGHRRWTCRHKALVVIAIENGMVSLSEARERWWLSAEEYLEWRTRYLKAGKAGLKALIFRRDV